MSNKTDKGFIESFRVLCNKVYQLIVIKQILLDIRIYFDFERCLADKSNIDEFKRIFNSYFDEKKISMLENYKESKTMKTSFELTTLGERAFQVLSVINRH